ncbi:phosphoribosylaminoimidazolesuccinocarboxamide synthase, partial [Priestia megaterium]|uniref:phosphoribosylaminoimidazolesuccinocarboxamide synthase n=1 Tax=Priestia megaterium TaxID=1404 RepID=UPI0028FC3154
TDHQDLLSLPYKNQPTPFNPHKKPDITPKPHLNNQITTLLFSILHHQPITTHFLNHLSHHQHPVNKLEILPLQLLLPNATARTLPNP